MRYMSDWYFDRFSGRRRQRRRASSLLWFEFFLFFLSPLLQKLVSVISIQTREKKLRVKWQTLYYSVASTWTVINLHGVPLNVRTVRFSLDHATAATNACSRYQLYWKNVHAMMMMYTRSSFSRSPECRIRLYCNIHSWAGKILWTCDNLIKTSLLYT